MPAAARNRRAQEAITGRVSMLRGENVDRTNAPAATTITDCDEGGHDYHVNAQTIGTKDGCSFPVAEHSVRLK